MFSMPPATTQLASPARMACAASATALSPEPQTLLMVSALTLGGTPPWMAACRAGFWPSPACTTFPMTTSSISSGSRPLRSSTARTTTAPRRGAGRSARPPWKRPIGVRTASTMTGLSLTAGPPSQSSSSRDRAMTRRWISLVPSPIVQSFASR